MPHTNDERTRGPIKCINIKFADAKKIIQKLLKGIHTIRKFPLWNSKPSHPRTKMAATLFHQCESIFLHGEGLHLNCDSSNEWVPRAKKHPARDKTCRPSQFAEPSTPTNSFSGVLRDVRLCTETTTKSSSIISLYHVRGGSPPHKATATVAYPWGWSEITNLRETFFIGLLGALREKRVY